MEFVNKMKKDGKLIMGIGHRIKSVSAKTQKSKVFKNIVISHCFSQIVLLALLNDKHFQINNPDMRVQILKDFVKQHFPATQLLDYALEVEKITTSKVQTLACVFTPAISVVTEPCERPAL